MKSTNPLEKGIVVIDNYDSFTFNLVQYLGELGYDPPVFRNDRIDLDKLRKLDPTGLVISPGPGTPSEPAYFGLSLKVLQRLSPTVPTLGVCLGHQGIAVAFGGKVTRAETLYHGKTTEVHHSEKGVFDGIPNPLRGARYHSLIIDPKSVPSELVVTARGPEQEIMGIKHESYPIYGVQFHPESILTEHGKAVLGNFLNLTKGETK